VHLIFLMAGPGFWSGAGSFIVVGGRCCAEAQSR
jgi:hypothetical protein